MIVEVIEQLPESILTRVDPVVMPLTGSPLVVNEAIKASELVASFGKRAGNKLLHHCLLSRVPAALKPRSLATVVGQLRERSTSCPPR